MKLHPLFDLHQGKSSLKKWTTNLLSSTPPLSEAKHLSIVSKFIGFTPAVCNHPDIIFKWHAKGSFEATSYIIQGIFTSDFRSPAEGE